MQTAYDTPGFAVPHIKWIFIRFQFLHTKRTEKWCVYILVKKDQCFNKNGISHHCKEQNLKTYAVQLKTKIFNLFILSLYKAPLGDFNQFLRELNAALKVSVKPKTEFLICGDKYRLPQRKQRKKNLLTIYNLRHTVKFATRIQNDFSREIHNIFVDSIIFSSSSTSPIANGLSDHDA
jgi:hypothetical protein